MLEQKWVFTTISLGDRCVRGDPGLLSQRLCNRVHRPGYTFNHQVKLCSFYQCCFVCYELLKRKATLAKEYYVLPPELRLTSSVSVYLLLLHCDLLYITHEIVPVIGSVNFLWTLLSVCWLVSWSICHKLHKENYASNTPIGALVFSLN